MNRIRNSLDTLRRRLCWTPLRVIALSGIAFLLLSSFGSSGLATIGWANGSTTVSIDPASQSVAVGDTVTTDVLVEDVVNLYGASFQISFDPTVVEVVGTQIQPGNFLSPDWILANTVDNVNGTIDYSVCQMSPSQPVTGTGVLATITWRGKAVGTSAIHFVSVQLGAPGGVPIPAGTEDGEIIVCVAPTITCPDDITEPNDLGQCSAVVTWPDPTVTGYPAPTVNCSPASGSTFPVDTTTVTCDATNTCGSAQCTFAVTVEDTDDPVLTLPADVTIECDASSDPSNTGRATAIDNCDTSPTITHSDDPDLNGCCGTGTIVRTWTATDAYDNSVSAEQTITVVDTTAPVFDQAAGVLDVTIECDESLDPSVNPNLGTATATDNCCAVVGDITIDYSDDADLSGCCGTGTIVRTWTAEDACGNESTYVQTITVVDTTAPVFDQAAGVLDVTIECDESLDPSVNPNLGTATATDNCCAVVGDITIDYSDDADLSGCCGTGTIVRTWTAEDACGNESTYVQTITVVDTTAPDITGPADVTIECDESTHPDGTGWATATDNCCAVGDIAIDYSDVPDLSGCCGTGTIVRTWTAEDACGNESTYVQTITVVDDNTAPVFDQAAGVLDVTIECDESTAPSNTGEPTATDNCCVVGDITIDYSDDADLSGCCGTGTIVRTWTASDACGNESTYVQTITVVDTTAPDITGPADVTIECDESLDPSVNPNLGTATATDNCCAVVGDITIDYSDDADLSGCCGTGTIVRTWTAEDACGNESTYVQTITVVDTTAPVFDQAAGVLDVTIECDESLDPSVNPNLGTATATDNCCAVVGDITIDYSDDADLSGCCGTGTIVRTWTAEDACGNESTYVQTITVVDTTAPDITGPADVTIECDESTHPDGTGWATATDNCCAVGDIAIDYSDVPDLSGCCGTGTIVRTWTAEDACGNESTYVQTITVVDDNTAPVFDQAAGVLDVTIECDESTAPSNTGEPTATDNCCVVGDITIDYSDDADLSGCCGTGTIVRTWTASDACGNESTYVQTITVVDTTAPDITGPADVTIECDESLDPSVNPNLGTATATDNCCAVVGDITIDYSDDADLSGCCGTGTIVRTWTAEDACGNESTYVQTITVVDTTAPVFDQAAGVLDVTIECDESLDPSVNPNLGTATATDNCCAVVGDITIDYSDDADLSGCCGTGTIVRTWTAEDACGNESTYVQTITVVDTTAPDITGPADVTIECDESTHPDGTGWATATDNCCAVGDIAIDYSDVPDLSGCCGTGTIVRTWTAEDACGNESTYVQTITVVDDNTAPVFDQAAGVLDVTIECDESTAPSNTGEPTATDNCCVVGDITIDYSDDADLSGCCGTGTIVRTWTASDACGNESTYVQTITVVDTTAPDITGPGDVTIECGESIHPNDTGWATATDNCDTSPDVTYSNSTSGTSPTLIARTWTATDDCWNVAQCVQVITVQHSTPTTITLSPASKTITTAQTVTYTVWATDTCGNGWDATSEASYAIDFGAGGSWTDNVYTSEFTGTWTVTANVDGTDDTATLTVTPGAAVRITLAPDPRTVTAGDAVTYTVTAHDGYGNNWDVTADAAYAITTGAGGSWTDNVCTSEFAGTWTVTATWNSLTDTATLHVITATVAEISLSPATAVLTAGQSIAYTVVATDTSGNSWDATSGTYFEVNSEAKGSWAANVYTSKVVGVWTVTAYYGGESDTASLTVNPSSLDHIVLSPDPATITAGQSQTYTVEAFDAYGNSWNATSEAAYSIDANAGGSWADNVYTSEFAGTWTVTATYNGQSDTASLTVNPAALDHIVLSPDPATITAGQSQTYIIEAFDTYGNSWDATAEADYDVDASAGGSWTDNVYTSEFVGDWTVTATVDSVDDAATLTVEHGTATTVALSPALETVTAGDAVTYTVWATDTHGNGWDATAEADYAIDSGAGGSWAANVYTSEFVGTWTVTATVNGVDDSATLTVTNPAPHLTSLSPISATAGGPAFVLTVNGTNFVMGSTAHWNGALRTTTVVSSTQLIANITAPDIATVGTASVTVVNPAPSGGTSNALPFEIVEFGPAPPSEFIYLPLVSRNATP